MKPHYVPIVDDEPPAWYMQFTCGKGWIRTPGPFGPAARIGIRGRWWEMSNAMEVWQQERDEVIERERTLTHSGK